uniref:Uncharacterized protein n=1 Tax=Anguilla anguilla TaxID=7936 RepID=A0A0E9SH39_ANGAN
MKLQGPNAEIHEIGITCKAIMHSLMMNQKVSWFFEVTHEYRLQC